MIGSKVAKRVAFEEYIDLYAWCGYVQVAYRDISIAEVSRESRGAHVIVGVMVLIGGKKCLELSAFLCRHTGDDSEPDASTPADVHIDRYLESGVELRVKTDSVIDALSMLGISGDESLMHHATDLAKLTRKFATRALYDRLVDKSFRLGSSSSSIVNPSKCIVSLMRVAKGIRVEECGVVHTTHDTLMRRIRLMKEDEPISDHIDCFLPRYITAQTKPSELVLKSGVKPFALAMGILRAWRSDSHTNQVLRKHIFDL